MEAAVDGLQVRQVFAMFLKPLSQPVLLWRKLGAEGGNVWDPVHQILCYCFVCKDHHLFHQFMSFKILHDVPFLVDISAITQTHSSPLLYDGVQDMDPFDGNLWEVFTVELLFFNNVLGLCVCEPATGVHNGAMYFWLADNFAFTVKAKEN